MGSRIISLTATLIPIVLISTSMFVYNSAKSTIDDSVTRMSQSETKAFNSMYESYEGTQNGAQVKVLVGELITNADTYEDEVSKIPELTVIDKVNKDGDDVQNAEKPQRTSDIEEYKENLVEIRNKIESKHTYNIELEYEDELVSEIKISYES